MSLHDRMPVSPIHDELTVAGSVDTFADTYESPTLSPEHHAMLTALADLYRRNLISRQDFDESADFLAKLHQS